MPKCKNNFNNKFRLLCSQESHAEEINWSSSDSSDYENVSNCDKHITSHSLQNRKRKRKKKVPKNISNLDITIIDVANDREVSRRERKEETSPILCTQYHPQYKWNTVQTSPIIYPKSINSQKTKQEISKSPILVLKTASPVYSPKVKKKLFTNIENVERTLFKSKSTALTFDKPISNDSDLIRRHSVCSEKQKDSDNNSSTNERLAKNIDFGSNHLEKSIRKENDDSIKLDDSLESLTSTKDLKLVNKVKTYFDSHFSSENATQITIQDSLTPKSSKDTSKTSDDIEIISTITNVYSNKNSSESIKEETELETKSKKICYKKDGLAFKLNMLLKKHNAKVSLWQHERFLASNSNFVIPKGEHLVFIIRNVEIKYGCFLLQARNIENEAFLILINSDYINNCNLTKDVILKIYEPYKILDFDKDFKVIINVCKFECEALNDS